MASILGQREKPEHQRVRGNNLGCEETLSLPTDTPLSIQHKD